MQGCPQRGSAASGACKGPGCARGRPGRNRYRGSPRRVPPGAGRADVEDQVAAGGPRGAAAGQVRPADRVGRGGGRVQAAHPGQLRDPVLHGVGDAGPLPQGH